MNPEIVLLALAAFVALAAVFFRDGHPAAADQEKVKAPAVPYLILAGLTVLTLFWGMAARQSQPDLMPKAMGLMIGALVGAVSYALGLTKWQAAAGKSAPLALGALALAAIALLAKNADEAGAVVGCAAAAWILSYGQTEEKNVWAIFTAIAMGAAYALNTLGASISLPDIALHPGTWMLLALSACAAISGFLPKGPLRAIAGSLLCGLTAYMLGEKFFLVENSALIGFGSALASLLVLSTLSETKVSSLRMVLAALIWLGAANGAFGLARGFGMTMALLVALACLSLAGSRRGVLTLGPFVSLALYRSFFQENKALAHSFDIGEHYSIMGLLIGLAIPLLAIEWLRASAGKTKVFGNLASALWVPVFCGVPFAVAIMLNGTGLVGFLTGLGIAAVVEAIRESETSQTVSLTVGISTLTAATVGYMEPFMAMDRDEKTRALSWILGGAFAVGLLIAFLSGELRKVSLTTNEQPS